MDALNEVVVTGDLGPNPAPVVELVWALHAQRGLRTTSLHLLTNDHAARWFHELEDGLEQLERVLGWQPEIRVHEPPIEDELTPEESVAWNEARWSCAAEALAEAGDRPVIFGLFAGRRRSMSSGVSQIAQLLGRPQDRLIDVRVSVRAAEGATGFFFPEQPEPTWNGVDPSSVEVRLAELVWPRLRGRVEDASSWRAAMAWLGTPVPGVEPPLLELLVKGPGPLRVLLNGEPVQMSAALATWTLALALARLQGDGWLAVDDVDPLHDALDHVRAVRGQPAWAPGSRLFKGLATGDWSSIKDRDGAFRKLRSDTRARLASACEERALPVHLVRPTARKKGKKSQQRIALAADRIRVEGWPVT